MNKITFTEIEASDYIGMSRSFLRQDRMNGTRENRTTDPTFLKIEEAFVILKTT
jgi:hypothetical protein